MSKKKLSAKEAAKVLGVHVDTVRKRAKAGKIKFTINKNGHYEFDLPDVAGAPKLTTTKVLFIIDQSSSMGGLERKMKDVLQGQADLLKAAPNPCEFSYITFADWVGARIGPIPGQTFVAPMISTGGCTALYNAVIQGLQWVQLDMNADKESSYLVMVITDGQDNRSGAHQMTVARGLADSLRATDRLTLVANGPIGSHDVMLNLGVPPGNIREWETSVAGLTNLADATYRGTQSYATTRGAGGQSLDSFYANVPSDVSTVLKALNNSLDDVTSLVKTERVSKNEDAMAIRTFAEKKFGAFEKGKFFYELTKSEKVQTYKDIIVHDKKAAKFYKGWETARKLLGLPQKQTKEIRVKPGSMGDFAVFVQSTSYNRKLEDGTVVVKLG